MPQSIALLSGYVCALDVRRSFSLSLSSSPSSSRARSFCLYICRSKYFTMPSCVDAELQTGYMRGERGIRRCCKREKAVKQNKIHFTKEILWDTETSNTHARLQLSIMIRSGARVLKWNAIELYTQLFQDLQFYRIGLQAVHRAIETIFNLSCDKLLLTTDHGSAKVDQKKIWTGAKNEESKEREENNRNPFWCPN